MINQLILERARSFRAAHSVLAAALLALASVALAQTNAGGIVELKEIPFEELFNIEITTVSKRPERLVDAASAIQVITPEDIRRSGASSLPEALRLAPNLHVAQVDSSRWAISARGGSRRFAT